MRSLLLYPIQAGVGLAIVIAISAALVLAWLRASGRGWLAGAAIASIAFVLAFALVLASEFFFWSPKPNVWVPFSPTEVFIIVSVWPIAKIAEFLPDRGHFLLGFGLLVGFIPWLFVGTLCGHGVAKISKKA